MAWAAEKFVQYAIQKTRNDASVLVMTDAPLMLSVSGARGIVGATMTPAVAERLPRVGNPSALADRR